MKEYAQVGTKLGDILIGMEMERKGHLIKAEMEKLTKTEDLMKKIKNEHMNKIVSSVIDMHSNVYGLTFNKDVYAFIGGSGEKTDWIMTLARLIADYKEIITEAQVAGRKQFLGANIEGEVYIHRDAEYMNKLVKEQGLAVAMAEMLSQDPTFEILTYQVKSPFEGLEDKLHSLGIGYELAKKLSQYLSEKMLCRGTTIPPGLKEQNIYKTLAKKINTEDGCLMDEYAKAMKTLVERISGKKYGDDLSPAGG